MNSRLPALWFCILMDAIGYLSFTIPGWGEFADILWAPLSAIIFFFSFRGRIGAYGSIANFAEEILPGADIIPTFTIAWFMARKQMRESLTRT